MKKFIGILVLGVLSIMLMACSRENLINEKVVNTDNIDEKSRGEITELRAEIQLMQEEIDNLKNQIDISKSINDELSDQIEEINKLRDIVYNLPDVNIKLVYINNITEAGNDIKLEADYITWLTGEGDDFPNGFKIVNEAKENKIFSMNKNTPIYVNDYTDNFKQKYIELDQFAEIIKKYNTEVPYQLFLIKGKIVLIEQVYTP